MREQMRERIMSSNPPTLEIGPSCRPFLCGENISYFDITSPEEAKKRAHALKLEDNTPAFFDYVSSSGDLTIVDRKYDIVFSSHVIEHTTDFIKHLQDVSNILNENGEYFLVIPDMRYCFDHFKNPTTLGDVLEAFYSNSRISPLRILIDEFNANTHNNSQLHWNHRHGHLQKMNIENLQKIINEKDNKISAHRWFLHPDLFLHIFHYIVSLKLIPFRCTMISPTPQDKSEFYVILKKDSNIQQKECINSDDIFSDYSYISKEQYEERILKYQIRI